MVIKIFFSLYYHIKKEIFFFFLSIFGMCVKLNQYNSLNVEILAHCVIKKSSVTDKSLYYYSLFHHLSVSTRIL